MTAEVWKSAPGFEGWYEVSNHGRIKRVKAGKSTRTGYILKQTPRRGRNGNWRRLSVVLTVNSVQASIDVHVLVARAFLGPCPPGKEVNHIDYNPLNNQATNLEYITHAENIRHSFKHGRVAVHGEDQGAAKLTDHDVTLIRNSPLSHSALALHYGVNRKTIVDVRTRRWWRHVP